MTNSKSSNSNSSSGCALLIVTVFVGTIGVAILYMFILSILPAVNRFFANVISGAKFAALVLLFIVVTIVLLEIVFYINHQKPLSYEQVVKLSQRRAKEYSKRNYRFTKSLVIASPEFKSHMDTTGRWYTVNQPLSTFPSLVADLLKGKHHEWVVIALEKDGYVFKVWANKGQDNQSVSLNCDINEIIQKCVLEKGYSVLRFHNHPNPDPMRYTTLLASEQDIISARSCSEVVCKHGINWFDFVVARGDYILFFSRIAEGLSIKGSSVSDLVDICGITPYMDYILQREYYHLDFSKNSIKLRFMFFGVLITSLFIVLTSVGVIINNSKKDRQASSDNTHVSTTISSNTTPTTTETTKKSIPDVTQDGINYSYDESLSGYVVTGAEDVENVKIPDVINDISVVAIGEKAFEEHKKLKSITFPNTIVEIRERAFHSCESLKSFTFPEKVTVISEGVLMNCSKLTTVAIKGKITTICDNAFEWCHFSTIKLPSSLRSIGDEAFLCSELSKITIPEGVTSIGAGAFKSTNLVSISLPNSLTSIGKQCFRYCDKLKSVRVPPNVKSLDQNVFWQCGCKKVYLVSDCQITGFFADGTLDGIKIVRYKTKTEKVVSSDKGVGSDKLEE